MKIPILKIPINPVNPDSDILLHQHTNPENLINPENPDSDILFQMNTPILKIL
jgi:hypothetical protein